MTTATPAAKKGSGLAVVALLLGVGLALAHSHPAGNGSPAVTRPASSSECHQPPAASKSAKCENCLAGRHRQCTKPVWNPHRNFTQCCDGIPISKTPP